MDLLKPIYEPLMYPKSEWPNGFLDVDDGQGDKSEFWGNISERMMVQL